MIDHYNKIFDCTVHGRVPETENGKCSYCEAGWFCQQHGPYDPTGHKTLLAYEKMTEAEKFLNLCPHCFEEKRGLKYMTDNVADYFCETHGWQQKAYCETCTPRKPKIPDFSKTESTRKYLPTLSDLVDRLTIVQQKELKIPEHREEYTKELEDIVHDLKLTMNDSLSGKLSNDQIIDLMRDVIVLTLMNCEIWHNESNFRKGIKDGNNLELTHGLNGIRNTAKNKIQELFGGRKDYKIDNVKAFKEWVPSGYGTKQED